MEENYSSCFVFFWFCKRELFLKYFRVENQEVKCKNWNFTDFRIIPQKPLKMGKKFTKILKKNLRCCSVLLSSTVKCYLQPKLLNFATVGLTRVLCVQWWCHFFPCQICWYFQIKSISLVALWSMTGNKEATYEFFILMYEKFLFTLIKKANLYKQCLFQCFLHVFCHNHVSFGNIKDEESK